MFSQHQLLTILHQAFRVFEQIRKFKSRGLLDLLALVGTPEKQIIECWITILNDEILHKRINLQQRPVLSLVNFLDE